MATFLLMACKDFATESIREKYRLHRICTFHLGGGRFTESMSPLHTHPPFQPPSADYSQPHSDHFGNFLGIYVLSSIIFQYYEGPNPATEKTWSTSTYFVRDLLGCDRGAEIPQGWTSVEVCRVLLLLPRGPGAHRSAIFFLLY